MKQAIKYRSECVLSFCISFFHKILSLFNTKLPVLNKFFEPIAVEVFKLFSKPLSHSNMNFFITCEMNSFEMLLQSCKEAEVRWCQIQAVGRVQNNFKSDVLFCH
jgi:hypothetical protein